METLIEARAPGVDGEDWARVRQSWERVLPIADAAAALFYGRLFELDPSLAGLFRGDMVEQGRKLMQTITVVVRSLDRFEQVAEAVVQLGRRHAGYGVQRAHYATVGAALLWTLARGLGEHFDAAHRRAWTQAYWTVADLMIRAQEEAEAAAA